MMKEPGLVLVIGAGGFVAGHLIAQLLDKGYRVRGTIHDMENLTRYKHITSLPHANSHLELIKLDLHDEKDAASWTRAFDGEVTMVFHVCGPHKPILRAGDPVNDIITPTIQGMQTLCELCDRNLSVKRVIHLSCLDTLADTFTNGKEYSEVDWNDVSQASTNPSAYAKTEAERYLHQYFAPASSIPGGISPSSSSSSLSSSSSSSSSSTSPGRSSRKKAPVLTISIIAGVILGPALVYQPAFARVVTWREAADESLTPSSSSPSSSSSSSSSWKPRLSASHRLFLSYLNGMNRAVPNLSINLSDVRDTATACMIAAESSRMMPGRYIFASASSMTHLEMLQIVHDNFRDEVKVPTRRVPDTVAKMASSFDRSGKGEYLLRHLGRRPLLNTVKARETGMAMRPPLQTIVDTCRFLLEHNMIEQQPAQGCCIS